MDKEQIKSKVINVGQEVDNAGHKIDDFVEDTAEKHNYPKWKIWLGLVVIGLAAVGVCRLAGWI